MRRRALAAAFIVLLATTGAGALEAPEVLLPAALQASLFARILGFDRALDVPASRVVVIGILRQRQYRPSVDAADELLAAVAALPEGDLVLRPILVEPGPEKLETLLDRQPLAALYVTPLRALEVETVAALARERRIRTLTGVPAYLERGLSTGLGLVDGRPEILVNLDAARAEGADYSSQLLALARVVP